MTELQKMKAKIDMLIAMMLDNPNIHDVERLAKQVRLACCEYLELQQMQWEDAN